MEAFTDNVIEFERGTKIASFTFSQKKFITRIQKLKEKYPAEVDFIANPDGSIFGHVPIDWVKINPKRQISEEQRQAAAERLARGREK